MYGEWQTVVFRQNFEMGVKMVVVSRQTTNYILSLSSLSHTNPHQFACFFGGGPQGQSIFSNNSLLTLSLLSPMATAKYSMLSLCPTWLASVSRCWLVNHSYFVLSPCPVPRYLFCSAS